MARFDPTRKWSVHRNTSDNIEEIRSLDPDLGNGRLPKRNNHLISNLIEQRWRNFEPNPEIADQQVPGRVSTRQVCRLRTIHPQAHQKEQAHRKEMCSNE